MADNATDFMEDQIAQAIFKAVSCTALTMTAQHIALFSVAPTDTGGGTEILTTSGYTRFLATAAYWLVNTSGTIVAKNITAWTYPANTGTAWTVTDMAIMNHATATAFTNYVMRGVLNSAVTIGVGDSFQFAASAVVVTLS